MAVMIASRTGFADPFGSVPIRAGEFVVSAPKRHKKRAKVVSSPEDQFRRIFKEILNSHNN